MTIFHIFFFILNNLLILSLFIRKALFLRHSLYALEELEPEEEYQGQTGLQNQLLPRLHTTIRSNFLLPSCIVNIEEHSFHLPGSVLLLYLLTQDRLYKCRNFQNRHLLHYGHHPEFFRLQRLKRLCANFRGRGLSAYWAF